ncbi:hypothetical protein [Enterobacter sp. JMULE2]|uniref:hypothetical protein n=1 Tax=Enterobacter sp. JMULE2 TaxID=2518340 RepID=UPI0015759DDB|nr:hypothetical protein [Enterobacter sp. JMULE2]
MADVQKASLTKITGAKHERNQLFNNRKKKEDNNMPPKMPPSPLIVNVGGTYKLTC